MRAFLLALCALFVPASALAQTDNVPAGKLPSDATPVAYRVDFTIVPEQERFSGHTEIDIKLNRAAKSIYMHGRDLHVTKATVSVAGKEMPVSFAQVSPLGTARLDFGGRMKPGKMTLKFDYDAPFGEGPSGLYRVKAGEDWYSWTQFESIDARAAFPSFDEPGFKTPFTVSIATKPGFVAASNAPEVGHSAEGALVRHRFAPTLPLPTYLVAMVTGPFVTAETMVAPTPQRAKPLPLRVIGTKEHADDLQYALVESGKIVTLLEQYFNQGFPYPKLDQIGSPVMPGAMENAGADIYGDSIIFLGKTATTRDKQTFGMVVAHELSHQWFGDLVTPAWWDDIWLNESFANWMGFRIGNEWRPDLNIGVNAIEEGFDAMKLDALTAGRPIHQRITRDGDINAAFDQITYGKGGQVVAMIAAYMGDTKFRDGVRLHMKRYLYGNATTDQFFTSIADAAKDKRVLASLRGFIDQQGFPVVTLHRRADGKLTATQARYAYFGTSPAPEHWIVPLCVRRAETRSCTLVDKPGTVVADPGSGALVPNAGGWGYYRFDLDPADWDALIAAAPGLPGGEALAVDDSLWAAFYAGHGSVDRLVAAARAMAGNKDSNAAVDNGFRLAELQEHGLISAEALPAYRKLIDSIYSPMLDKLGFDPVAGAYASDDPDRQKLRAAVVRLAAGWGHNAGVRAKLVKAADAFIAGDMKALDSQYRTVALEVAVNERGLDFAKSLVEQGLASNNTGKRQTVLRAVAASGNAEIARWFFNDLKDPRLPPFERMLAAASFLDAAETRDMAFDFLTANFDSFANGRGGGGIFSARAAGMFQGLCSLQQADVVEAKLRPVLSKQGSTLALDRALETIRNCAKFREAKGAEVSAAVMGVR